MTKTKSTKRALLMSGLALLVCVSMLIGSTFAWFTDSVTSAGNKIQSGTLKLDLELLDKDGKFVSIKDSHAPIFDYDKWEPGYTDVKVLKIENEGSLAIKWMAKFVAEYELTTLAKVIDVYICSSENPLSMPEDRDLDGYKKVGTVYDFVNTIESTGNGNLEAGKSVYLGIALKMQESAGNEYQGMPIGSAFDIQILATQYTSESDSFNNQYDKEAAYPIIATEQKENEAVLLVSDEFKVLVPAEAEKGFYKFVVENEEIKTAASGEKSYEFDLALFRNGVKVEPNGTEYEVRINVGDFLNIIDVKHNGESILFEYQNGEIFFKTSSFSPFAITYKDAAIGLETDENGNIIAGLFENLNPADSDETLKADDSEYIAVNYEVDGVTYYEVKKRNETTIVVAAGDYTATNSNFEVRANMSGNLYKVFQEIRAYDFATVYLLPGTYNEGTTITVDTSCDIIGLGEKEDVKVVKVGAHSSTATKPSNRHLFNCTNNDSSKYIQVTIRNLSLNASEKNSYIPNSGIFKGKQVFEDNAAVQSIRRAKVKCYDLIVEKVVNDASSIAFYVNSTNKVDDGNTYPAYMYVENTVVNSQNVNGVADAKAAKSYFYYSGLTYANGEKEYSSNYTVNEKLAADDWDWLN